MDCGDTPPVPLPPPNISLEPRALANWKANDCLATALIMSTLTHSERAFVNEDGGSKECWDAILKHHQNEGSVRQVMLLQQALTMRCTKETPLPETADKICEAVERAFSMGDVK